VFLRSYDEHPAGIEHDFIVLLKGFDAPIQASEHMACLKRHAAQTLFAPDRGFDVGAYAALKEINRYDCLCFCNSHSFVLAHDWLLKLWTSLTKPKIGLVGATSSYESIYSNLLNCTEELERKQSLLMLLRTHRRRILLRRYRCAFPPFPNPHVRTNGFMIWTSVWQQVTIPRIRSKLDALQFESGFHSLTRQVRRLSLDALLVGADGRAYKTDDWHKSNSFRQADQDNLLIADNRTTDYMEGDVERRARLSTLAWGKLARPA
jgi:hypothetical protein